MSPVKETTNNKKPVETTEINKKGVVGRQEMLAKLKESAKNNPTRIVIEYEKLLCECLDYLHSIFEKYLCPFSKGPVFIELHIFNDVSALRRQIVGTPRGSLHNALSNPHHYLQCKCCELRDNEQILATMPDVAVAYKLHLECNKYINLFDWLQAFAMVVENQNADNDENEEDISQEVQARFTRATAELQFLGLIKQAKHKADHVMRNTW
jgi:origin recognition complex subunit 3